MISPSHPPIKSTFCFEYWWLKLFWPYPPIRNALYMAAQNMYYMCACVCMCVFHKTIFGFTVYIKRDFIIFYFLLVLSPFSSLSYHNPLMGLQSRSAEHYWSSLSQESCRQIWSIVCMWEKHWKWERRGVSYYFDTWILITSYTKLIAEIKMLPFFKGRLEEWCICFFVFKALWSFWFTKECL